MSGFVATEKGVPIRQPSTANLMIDSADRNSNDLFPNTFTITQRQSILNGYFTRIATSEVVLEWKTPNINGFQDLSNNWVDVDISGVAPFRVNLPTNFYTVEGVMKQLVGQLNDLSGSTGGITWTLAAAPGENGFLLNANPLATTYWRFAGTLANQLSLATPGYLHNQIAAVYSAQIDLRPCRFLDFVSSQLTYQQELKDATTSITNSFDVLCRWYFAYDNPVGFDDFGFPILMGYQPFILRRLFSPPKNIRWNPNQPIGSLSFQVYDNNGKIQYMNAISNWLMTLQISEV